MDYEKEYKKKLEDAKYWHDCSEGDIPAILEEIFSELKESEDEKIRKELIEYFKHYSGGDIVSIKFPKWVAWLEKQGEQKPAWSEDDKEFLRRTIKATKDVYPMTAKWLELLKQRLKGE